MGRAKFDRQGGLTDVQPPEERPKQEDERLKQWLAGAAENPGTLTKKQKRDRARSRVRYDFDTVIIDAVGRMAERLGTSASQLAALCLLRGVLELMDEDGALRAEIGRLKEPSRSPRLEWNLVLRESDLRKLEDFVRDSQGDLGFGERGK